MAYLTAEVIADRHRRRYTCGDRLKAYRLMPDERTKQEYRTAYHGWIRQLDDLHEVLLNGQRLDPPRLKGLLNREARAKLRYDVARERLLGITARPQAEEEGEYEAR